MPVNRGAALTRRRAFSTASIEERTAVLETRWEETAPTLVTKADLREGEVRLLKWGIGAGIALLAVVVALFTANTARIDSLAVRIDRLDEKIDARFDAIMVELRELRK